MRDMQRSKGHRCRLAPRHSLGLGSCPVSSVDEQRAAGSLARCLAARKHPCACCSLCARMPRSCYALTGATRPGHRHALHSGRQSLVPPANQPPCQSASASGSGCRKGLRGTADGQAGAACAVQACCSRSPPGHRRNRRAPRAEPRCSGQLNDTVGGQWRAGRAQRPIKPRRPMRDPQQPHLDFDQHGGSRRKRACAGEGDGKEEIEALAD